MNEPKIREDQRPSWYAELAADLANAKQYKVFKSVQEEDDWNGVWQPVYSS